MYVTLPTPAGPRVSISSDKEGWFINADGSIGSAVDHEWTHLLLSLHIYRHLPSTAGIVLVGSLGVMLIALIISGFQRTRESSRTRSSCG